jgi:serine phosphatase RsbU (regulator of sigma subunit)
MIEIIQTRDPDQVIRDLICWENPDEREIFDLLEILGFVIMERMADAGYRVLGQAPIWFSEIFNRETHTYANMDPRALSPFVENFLPIAEQFWSESASGIMPSGPWIETDASGTEHHLELSAVSLKRKQILLLQLLGQAYKEKKGILQRSRENRLDYDLLIKTQAALNKAHDLLLIKQKQLDEDLTAAAEIQRRFLPGNALRIEGIRIASNLSPCTFIAGDMFQVVPLDKDHLAICILDVSGHGAAAAMMAVSVCQMLQPHCGVVIKRLSEHIARTPIISPREVLEALDKEFPLERFDRFFTIFYGVLHPGTGALIYSNAGHPQPILLHANGSIDSLDKGGTIIGLGGMIPFEEEEIRLQKGDKVVLYSDGVTELANANGESFGIDRLLELLSGNVGQPIETLLETVHLSLMDYVGTEQPKDDISLLGIEFDGEEKNERK